VTSRHFFSVNYTFGKALGVVSGSQGALVDPFNMGANCGVLSYDHTHLLNTAYSFRFASIGCHALAERGAPIQPNNGGNLNLSGPINNRTWLGTDAVTLQPLLTCNPQTGLAPNQDMNPACFALPTALGLGNNGNIVFPYRLTSKAIWPFSRPSRSAKNSAFSFAPRPTTS